MAWKTVLENNNWEYSNDPDNDKRSADNYDYTRAGHVNGIRENADGSSTYVLCRQRAGMVSCPVGHGQIHNKNGFLSGAVDVWSGKTEQVDGQLKLIGTNGQSNGEVLKGQSLYFDGATNVNHEQVTLAGDFEISFSCELSAVDQQISREIDIPNDYLRFNGVCWRVVISGVSYLFDEVTLTSGVLSIIRVGSTLAVSIGAQSQNITANEDDFVIQFAHSSGIGIQGNIWNFRASDNNGNSLWIPGTHSEDTKVPMAINGVASYGTVSGATLSTFYHEHTDGYGFDLNELGYSDRNNCVLYSETLSNAVWVKRGAVSITDNVTEVVPPIPGAVISKVESLGAISVDDFYQNITSGFIADQKIYPELYIKRISTSGTLLIGSPISGNIGNSSIDLASIGDEWVKYSDVAVISNAWYASVNGFGGFHIRTATGPLSFYLCMIQQASFPDKEYIKTTSFPITGYQQAKLDNPSQDILGNPLQYPKPRLNAKCYGYAGTWEGVATSTLKSELALSGDFIIVISHNGLSELSDNRIFEGGLYNADPLIRTQCTLELRDSGVFMLINASGQSPTVSNINSIDNTVPKVLTISRAGSVITASTNTGETGSASCELYDYLIGYISKYNAIIGSINFIKIYDSTDTLIHHWIPQAKPDSTQTTIYDIVGGNHATLVGATTPFFTTPSECATHLIENGYDDRENLVPYSEDFSVSEWAIINAEKVGTNTVRFFDTGSRLAEYYQIPNCVGRKGIARFRISGSGIILCRVIEYGTWTATNNLITLTDEIQEVITERICTAGAGGIGAELYRSSQDGDVEVYIESIQLCVDELTDYVKTDGVVKIGQVPASANTPTLDVFGNALSVLPDTLPALDAGYIEFPQSPKLLSADIIGHGENDPINFLFEPDGDQRKISYDDLLPQYGDELTARVVPTSMGAGWIDNGDGTYTSDNSQTAFSAIVWNNKVVSGDNVQVSLNVINYSGTNGFSSYSSNNDVTTGTILSNTGITKLGTIVNSTGHLALGAGADVAGTVSISWKKILSQGANVNNQYGFGTNGLYIYAEPQVTEVITKANNRIGAVS